MQTTCIRFFMLQTYFACMTSHLTLNIVKLDIRPWAILMQIEYICIFEKRL